MIHNQVDSLKGCYHFIEFCIIYTNLFYRSFSDEQRQKIKICVDTAHIFAAGYDIGDTEKCIEFIELFERTVGWDNVVVVHLNDSKVGCSSCKDRHADIGKGMINEEGFRIFVNFIASKNIPMVLETPCGLSDKASEIALVKSWLT